jgi:hypothetical protein
MEGVVRILVVLVLVSLASGGVWAAEPFIYPAKGQSPEQMEKDKASIP